MSDELFNKYLQIQAEQESYVNKLVGAAKDRGMKITDKVKNDFAMQYLIIKIASIELNTRLQ